MKKIFTFITLLAATLTASAQLSFTCNDKEIPNGSTFTSSQTDPGFDAMGAVFFTPHICIKSETTENVTVNVRSLDGRDISLCFGGNCINGTFLTKQGQVEAGIPRDIQVDAGGGPITGTQTYKAEIVAYVTSKADEAISMTLIMTNDEEVLSVGSVENDKENVTISNRTLSYRFATPAERTISLFTANGQTVASWTVNNTEGTISLDNLKPHATYLYTVPGTSISGKVLLK